MQTLRKKNSPCKFKNEPTRFLGEGVSFKAKLIGILEVSEARGDRMCQAALADLKMAIRAAGEHKQRIAVQVSIDGLRLRDEKTGDCLYHHPVHKISFIAQDMSDSRAFGYIFGSPDIGHRFFGIKTDKAASQVVIAMRDLFQVVFELKKKEIELAKQHIEQNAINAIKFHTSGIFVEPAPDTKGAAGSESSLHRIRSTSSEAEKSADRKTEPQSGVIADLLDLQFELNSLQQEIHHMVTPEGNQPSHKMSSENAGASTDDLFGADPFGDSFANMTLKETVQPILPPPPSSSKRGHLERQQTVPAPQSSATSSPAVSSMSSKTPPPQSTIHWFDKETENLLTANELANLSKPAAAKKEQEDSSLNVTPHVTQAKSPQIDVFTELDPLGTGLIKPYVDKKDFFQHLKNPPKKVLKDLVSTSSSDTFPTNFNITTEPLNSVKVQNEVCSMENDRFEDSNFANFDRFDENEVMQPVTLSRPESPEKKEAVTPRPSYHQPLSVSLPPEETTTLSKTTVTSTVSSASTAVSLLSKVDKESGEPIQAMVKLPSPKKYLQSVRKRDFDIDLPRGQSIDKPFPVDFPATSDSPASPLRSCSSDANSRLSSSSAEMDLVPEPPPRGAGSIFINPPPLPPKKQGGRGGIKPPPRPPHTEGHFHYDFLEREETSPSPTRSRNKSPAKETKSQFDDNFSPPPQISAKSDLISRITTSAFEDSFSSMIPTTTLSTFFTSTNMPAETKKTKPSLDITLSQLTSSNLDELASSLGMTVQALTSLTLQQLTECLATLSAKEANNKEEPQPLKEENFTTAKPSAPSAVPEINTTHIASTEPLFKTNFEEVPQQNSTYDKYAVFRELLEMEQMKEETSTEEKKEEPTSVEWDEKESEKEDTQPQEDQSENKSDSLVSLVNLTVKLPPSAEDLMKEESEAKVDESSDGSTTLTEKQENPTEEEDQEKETEKEPEEEVTSDSSTIKQSVENELEEDTEKTQPSTIDVNDEKGEASEKDSDINETFDTVVIENNAEETNGSTMEKAEVKSSTSTSSDRYAALREIMGEPEEPPRINEEEQTSRQSSPVMQSTIQPPSTSSTVQPKNLVEVELMNLFSDTLPPPLSPKKQVKQEDDLKTVAMDIFEEIKMLNTGTHRTKDTSKPTTSSALEDVFSPFAETSGQERDDGKEDNNWAKFDTGVFTGSDKSSCEGPRSVGGTSPWSPDGKDFHREASFKGNAQRHSGDSDNEWKDEEESEESNGRTREGRFWCGRHPRFDAMGFEERSFYEESTSGEKRDKSFRERLGRKSRAAPWSKGAAHRPRDPTPWHEESQWDDEPRCYPPHRKMPYKDEEDQYEAYWKCRPKPQRWNWGGHDHGTFYDEERKRKLMLWNEEDRFGSQESMGYEDDDRWFWRKYERRRWEDDGRFWGRRGGPPDADYPMREAYYYYRESRERPHEYPSAWDEEYGSDRPLDDSPRYNPTGRKRHWPKRPNSANEGRNSDLAYTEPRSKFGASRSECSDNDSDPYLRPSQRSRSRESYWGSDQEYDSWGERPYWSEGPDVKSETLHRKRIARHKTRQTQQTTKSQSPFEDDFAQCVEHVESPAAAESMSTEPRIRPEIVDQKREAPPSSPSSTTRCPKEHVAKRDIAREHGKRSSFFEDDLTPTASASSDTSDRQRLPSDLKATPEELPCDSKEAHHQSVDGFASEDSGRDSFFNGDLRFDDDAFAFKSELEDSVPDHRATTLPLKNSRQSKYGPGNNNNNNKGRSDQYIRKSESVNIFVRENDPFDDDDFFN